MQNTIFTVGHSSHSWEHFRSLIEAPDVGVVLDVRSNPRSRLPHFHKHELRYRLNAVGISYLHLGDQLGGRPTGGAADYETMAAMAPFRDGIAKVLEIAGRCRPTLMCAEHEPLECHRCLLVARHLVECHGAHVAHVLRDGPTKRRKKGCWQGGETVAIFSEPAMNVSPWRIVCRHASWEWANEIRPFHTTLFKR